MQGSNPRLKYGAHPSAAHAPKFIQAATWGRSVTSQRILNSPSRARNTAQPSPEGNGSLQIFMANPTEISGRVGKFNPDTAKGYCNFFSCGTKFCGIDPPTLK